ncbi:MAG: hypothetical protein FWG02_05800 [Holophagaceae bacterium]|nr:hypothetical protein [Holophagaceae bacterium]
MNNLAKLTLALLTACPILIGQTAPKKEDAVKPPAHGHNIEVLLTSKLFKINYAIPENIKNIVNGLVSQYGTVTADNLTKTLTVRDLETNLKAIEAAIEVLDESQPPSISVELWIDVIWASNATAKGSGEPVPERLSGVVSTLSKTLGYKQFAHGGVVTHRLSESSPRASGFSELNPGFGLPSAPGMRLNWSLSNCKISQDCIMEGNFGASFLSSSISNAAINLGFKDKNIIGSTMLGGGVSMIIVVSMYDPDSN